MTETFDHLFGGYGASIGDGDWWITLGPQGSRNAFATAVHSKEHGLRWWVGCQQGITTEQLQERIAQTHKAGSEHFNNYCWLIGAVLNHPGLIAATAKAKAGAA